MDTVNLLNEATQKVVELVEQLQRESFDEILDKGPVIVHQRLCGKLVEIARLNPGKTPRDVPEMVKVMDAIDLLEEIFPQVKLNIENG